MIITLWLFNIAMENCPFIDDFPIKTSIYKGFSMAMLNNQMVYDYYMNQWRMLVDPAAIFFCHTRDPHLHHSSPGSFWEG
jgi:hypothetical protein